MKRDEMRGLAFAIMFLLMIQLEFQGIEVPNGQIINVINSTQTIEIPQYAIYKDHAKTFWFLLIPLFGFILMMVERREDKYNA